MKKTKIFLTAAAALIIMLLLIFLFRECFRPVTAGTEKNVIVLKLPETSTEKPKTAGIPVNTVPEDAEILPNDAPEAVKKRFPISSAKIIGTIITDGKSLYAADRFGIISSFTDSGTINWTYSSANSPNEHNIPLYMDNTVYFAGGKELVYLDSDTGQPVFQTGLTDAESHADGRKLAAYDGKILYILEKSLSLIDPVNGAWIHEVIIRAGSAMSPSVYNGLVYLVDKKGTLLAVDMDSEKVLSRLATGALHPEVQSITFQGTSAFFAGRRGMITAVSVGGMKILWEKDLAESGPQDIKEDIECGDGSVYVFSKNRIIGLAASSGETRFTTAPLYSAPPLYREGRLYAGTVNGFLHVLNAGSGKTEKKLDINGIISTRPVFSSGDITAGTEQGEILIINPRGIK